MPSGDAKAFSLSNLRNALDESMALLEQPEISVSEAARAHDMLFAAVSSSSPRLSGAFSPRWSAISDAMGIPCTGSSCGTDTKEDGRSIPQWSERDVHEWILVHSDLYRALLVASHLLLEMCPRREGSNGKDGEGRYGCRKGARIHLDGEGTSVLQRNAEKCTLILHALSTLIVVVGQKHRKNRAGNSDWHDEFLPRSRYSLLRSCLEVGADGERVIPFFSSTEEPERMMWEREDGDFGMNLPPEDIAEQAVEFSRGTDEHGDNIALNSNKEIGDVVDSSSEGDEDGILCLSLTPAQVAKEENTLLDIAFPTSEPRADKRKMKKKTRMPTGKRERELLVSQSTIGTDIDGVGGATVTDIRGYGSAAHSDIHHSYGSDGGTWGFDRVSKDGYLELVVADNGSKGVDGAVLPSDDKQPTDYLRRRRCCLSLHSCGILSIEPALHLPSTNDAVLQGLRPASIETEEESLCHYLVEPGAKCEPVSLGNTFHFQLDRVRPIELVAFEEKDVNSKSDKEDLSSSNTKSRAKMLCPVRLGLRTERLIFGVDESTGGGLADGFAWVNAITDVSTALKLRNDVQEQLRRQWKDDATWLRSAGSSINPGSMPLVSSHESSKPADSRSSVENLIPYIVNLSAF